MEHFSKSLYNIIKDDGERLLLLNTLRGSFLGFEPRLNEQVMEQLNNPDVIIRERLFQILLDNGFIISNRISEKEQLNTLKNSFLKNDALNLILFTTEKCNFRCKYCYETFEKATMTEEVQNGIIAFVKDNIRRHKSLHVHWFGGEPLLCMDIIQKLTKQLKQICRENRVLYNAGITTNGYFLTPENLELLKECSVYRYQFTLDGLCATHDKQRVLYNGNGTWANIIENLRYLRDSVKSGLISVSIRTNLTKEIFEQREEYLEFITQEFGSDRRFVIELGLASDFGIVQEKEIINRFCTKEQLYETIVCALKHNLAVQNIESIIRPGGLVCYAWRDNSFSVRPDGVISKCTINLYNETNKIGDIRNYKDGFYSGSWDADKVGIPGKCAYCVKYPICLKVNCKMPTHADCSYDVQYLEQLLPYICKSQYGYKEITG